MFVSLLSLAALSILPSDRRIEYVGRFDRRKPDEVACQWPASEVHLNVRGASVQVEMDDKGEDRWAVIVDAKPTQVITAANKPTVYTIPLGAKAIHSLRLVKRTEAFVGTTTFLSFAVPDGELLRPFTRRRKIEVIGDSITCGFGNEGANQNEHFTPATENAYMSYASIAARDLNADATLIAWSGRKMWPDNTMPAIYNLNLPNDPTSTHDFSQSTPQVVVINLATNDFGKTNPDEKEWTGAYEQFIRRVWGHYPHATIYMTMGGMMSDNYPAGHKALTTLRGYLEHLQARMRDSRVHILEFPQQKMEDGIGSDWHPSLKTDKIMGDMLADAIKRDLKW